MIDSTPDPELPPFDGPTVSGDSEILRAGGEAMARGELGEALRIFERAVEVESGTYRVCALVNIASVKNQLGEHSEAAERYREALGQMPAEAPRLHPSTLIGLSQALQHLGELDEAQEHLDGARELLAVDGAPGDLRFACLVSATAVALHRHQFARAIELAHESLHAAWQFAPEQAGHPLNNLAAAHFETGRWELAEDFAGQALIAFEVSGNPAGVAETQLNLATMYVRLGRFDAAEPLLSRSQQFFTTAGAAYYAGIGWKMAGFIAQHRDQAERAEERYHRALRGFEESGAVIDAADVRTRLATLAFAAGRLDVGETELAAARATYAEHGLTMHCAQLDAWHAGLLEPLVESVPGMLSHAAGLAIPAALILDAARYELPDGTQRENWDRRIADPALRLAFRYAFLAGDATLLADLIEMRCAGTTLDIARLSESSPHLSTGTLEPFEPPAPTSGPGNDALQLGTALAAVAAGAGLPVTPPPHVAVPPDGHLALAGWITAAEQRYDRRLRADRVVHA
ncbi:tetratricopeptide repeat protein [Nocardia huaxiensis]|uniref:tetratricopeptide repeat protein n=1 Tax=Nocardia huaxiensis TaxID=2755382 RepID=UPI001E4FE134|nr:tetratricopeptide repeat protein [Nocardia huaxiensis]UFS93119.1 tetratricopeptide repeat protein [Nocardia huaxiensis]